MGSVIDRSAVIGVCLILLTLMTARNSVFGAEFPEEFFKGKTITWIISSETGGPADLLARIITPFLAKSLSAKIRVENRKTDEGVNYIYKQGTRDGLTLGVKDRDSLIGGDILKAPGVQYETDKLNFVADVYPISTVFQISPKVTYKSLDALRSARGLRSGGTSARGAYAIRGAVMLEILGLNGKVITGFKGKKDLTLAVARGELDFVVQSDTTAAQEEKDGYVHNLFVVGHKRSTSVPHLQTMTEFGASIPKGMEAVHGFIRSGGTAVVLPPGVPQDRVEYMRKIFKNLSSNPELQQAITKATGDIRPFVPGQELQEAMAEIKADTELAAKLDFLFKKYTAVR